jgi:hypothetical protein
MTEIRKLQITDDTQNSSKIIDKLTYLIELYSKIKKD